MIGCSAYYLIDDEVVQPCRTAFLAVTASHVVCMSAILSSASNVKTLC